MRIVYHVCGGVVGGAESQVEYLINNLPDDVNPLITYENPHIEKFLFKNVRCRNVFRAFSPNTLARKLQEFRPDIIQFYHSPFFYNGLSKYVGHPVKVIEIAHNRTPFAWDCSTYPKDRTDVLVCVSPDAQNHYVEKRGRDVKVVLIPNGVDSSKFFPTGTKVERNRPLGGFCGRLEDGDGKGVESIIKVVSQLPVDFELVGYDFGNYRQRLKNHHNIKLRQFTSNIAAYYQNWDFFVSCSPKEGFGLAIAEAMACGLPCVVLDCGGVCHYLKHLRHAYIAKSIEDVNNGIRTVLNGAVYYPLEVDFSAKRMADDYVRLYKSLLSNNEGTIEIMSKEPPREVVSEFVLGVVPDGWQGVKHALESRVHGFCEPGQLVATISRKMPTEIIFGGFLPHWFTIAKHVRLMTKAPIIITYHSTAVLNEFDDVNRRGLVHAIDAVRKGYANAISLPHEGMARAFNQLYKVNAIYEPNRIRLIPPPPVQKLPGLHIGIFGTGMPWKNTDTQILAAAVTPGMTTVHLQHSKHQDFLNQLGINYKIHPYYTDREKFYSLAAQMTINLAVTLTECFGYFALESVMLGVPAIVGATTPSYRMAEGALKKCIVNYIDDPAAISDAIMDVMDNYEAVLEEGMRLCRKMLP